MSLQSSQNVQTNSKADPPRVHPLLVILLGSTMAALVALLRRDETSLDATEQVPHRIVAIDGLKYKDLLSRMEEAGYDPNRVEKWLPRDQYLPLENPFAENFDFGDSHHVHWQRVIYEDALERLAQRPAEQPGCAGTPALGAARVHGNRRKLRDFFRRHAQNLTRLQPDTLHLLPGIVARFETTFRGGFGTGSALLAGTLLRDVLNEPPKEMALSVGMPDIWESDERARAQAYAMLAEIAEAHREGESIELLNGEELAPPFSRVVPVFPSNGRLSLDPGGFLRQQASMVRMYTRADVQATFWTRRVDVTEEAPHDHWGNPAHVGQESSFEVRAVQEAAPDYLAVALLKSVYKERRSRFEEAHSSEVDLAAPERERVESVVADLIDDHNLTADGLVRNVDPDSTTGALRRKFEKHESKIQQLGADAIKEHASGLQQDVVKFAGKAEKKWDSRMRKLAKSLPTNIAEDLKKRLGDQPHLVLHALDRVASRLQGFASDLRSRFQQMGEKRGRLGQKANQAVSDVQNASTLMPFGRDEVVRDAVGRAHRQVFQAAQARLKQEQFERALKLVEDGVPREQGGEPIPALAKKLNALRHEQERRIRREMSERAQKLATRAVELGELLDREAGTFTLSLLHKEGSAALKNRLERFRSDHSVDEIEAITRFLKKEASLDETVEEIKPQFSLYSERNRSIEDVLRTSPEKRQKVLNRLRLTAEPFTPTDKVVEQQHGLRDRRDSVLIHSVPGGSDGYIGQMLLKEGVCENENLIIESGDGNIYSYYVRDGLPYYALKLDNHRKSYERYMQQLGNIPPHTQEGPHELIEAPSESIRSRVSRLALVANALWGEDVVHELPDGRVRFSYEAQAPQGFTEQKEDTHEDMEGLVRWLADNIDVFRHLDSRVDAFRENDPKSYQHRLSEAYEHAGDEDGRALRVALHNAGLSLLDGSDDNGRAPGSNGVPA